MERLETDKKLYTFDLFDTLVCRPLKRPFHVFDLVEAAGVVSYRLPGIRHFGFRRWRILAERIARKISGKEDIAIWNIYRVLGWVIKNPAAVLRKELALEYALLGPIPQYVQMFSSLVAQGKRCCIVTDMYLPPAFLRRIVRKNLALEPAPDIFASSRIGLTKHSGNLYRFVAAHYGVDFSDIQHIGDNAHSDCNVPRDLGIDVHKVAERTIRDSARSVFEYFASHELERSPFARIGYSLVGPACMAFAQFIKEDMEQRGLQKVFFCARDTYLVKEAFERLAPAVSSSYLRVSRRALYVPAFAFHGNSERFFEGRISGREFFERLDMEVPAALGELEPSRNRALFLRALEENDFMQRSQEEARITRAYLHSKGFHGDLALVDLGWRGTLQETLKAVQGAQCRITGYYFGNLVDAADMRGFYFQNCAPLKRLARIFQALPVFEFLFTEPVRSVKRITLQDETFRFEYVDDESPEQIAQRHEIARGCRQFFDDYGRVMNMLQADDEQTLKALDALFDRFLARPEAAVVDAFRSVGHAEGFGGSQYGPIIEDGPFTLSGYRNSYWRAVYVARANGLKGWLGRRLHSFVYAPPIVFLIYRRHGFWLRRWRSKTAEG